ncbi:hypothetical protein Cni_G15447 [Canna indica]|uniref:Uncharacterized protein n=1 Tax=Canna indica TaxID=4628 RepID=A0AAQ3KH07_9LILI|nr:hypothetical protein Cni_G15447 [Canna indica]
MKRSCPEKRASGVASTRRFPSDTGAFADWVATSAAAGRGDDLCLGFSGGLGAGSSGGGVAGGVVWAGGSSSTSTAAAVNYGVPTDMGMVVLASAASFHQHQQHESLLPTSASSEQHSVIPLLAATPCLVDGQGAARAKAGGIQFWQPAQPQSTHHFHSHLQPNPNPNPNPNLSEYLRKPVPTLLDAGGILAGCGAAASVGGAPTCQDCGNQAKKDCSHRRCRTCCKSRGYECSTHVKSTWVPAARRRERQQPTAVAISAPKKLRLDASQPEAASHTSNSNATPSRSFDTTSSHQDASVKDSLPRHVRAPAMFKCVRVSSIDDGDGEYAYHAMVKIGGRIFKGFLYGQGLDEDGGDGGGKDAMPNMSMLHLGNQNGGASSSTAVLPSDFFGGPNYGNQIG